MVDITDIYGDVMSIDPHIFDKKSVDKDTNDFIESQRPFSGVEMPLYINSIYNGYDETHEDESAYIIDRLTNIGYRWFYIVTERTYANMKHLLDIPEDERTEEEVNSININNNRMLTIINIILLNDDFRDMLNYIMIYSSSYIFDLLYNAMYNTHVSIVDKVAEPLELVTLTYKGYIESIKYINFNEFVYINDIDYGVILDKQNILDNRFNKIMNLIFVDSVVSNVIEHDTLVEYMICSYNTGGLLCDDLLWRYILMDIDFNDHDVSFDDAKEELFKIVEMVSKADSGVLITTVEYLMYTTGLISHYTNILIAVNSSNNEFRDDSLDMILDIMDIKLARESTLFDDFVYVIEEMIQLMLTSLNNVGTTSPIDYISNIFKYLIHYKFSMNHHYIYTTGQSEQTKLNKSFFDIYNELVLGGIVATVNEELELDLMNEHDNRNYVTSCRLYIKSLVCSVMPYYYVSTELHKVIDNSSITGQTLISGDTGFILKVIHDTLNLYFVEEDGNEPRSIVKDTLGLLNIII